MPCYSPIKAWYSRELTKDGKRFIVFNPAKGYADKKVDIPFKKPSPYTGSSFSYKCPNCESEFIIRVIKEHRLGQFKVFVRNEFLSPKFNAVMALKNKPTV